jgi:hypothetical protein
VLAVPTFKIRCGNAGQGRDIESCKHFADHNISLKSLPHYDTTFISAFCLSFISRSSHDQLLLLHLTLSRIVLSEAGRLLTPLYTSRPPHTSLTLISHESARPSRI